MEYEVVLNNECLYGLVQDVNCYIAKGWEPIGGVSAVNNLSDGSICYHQAIVRKENNES